MIEKKTLRAELKQRRRDFVNTIPASQRGLLFRRPPGPVVDLIPQGAVVAVYYEVPSEAPASHYARWFFERGHRIALPWFAALDAPMQFREWRNPMLDDQGMEPAPFDDGTFNWLQPPSDADLLTPYAVFAPLLGFTATGERIGYGGGHYDRALAARSHEFVFGLGWDCQLVDQLPLEPHDCRLDAIVTPTRLYGPF